MRSVLTAVVGALALMATGPAAVGPSPGAGAPLGVTPGPAHSPRAEAAASATTDVVARILATDDGTFSATYHVGPPLGHAGPTATVVVAQRAAAGHSAFLDPRGEWSYLVTWSNGTLLAWTQVRGRATWCQRLRPREPIRCGGPVAVEESNGFAELDASFVTGVAVAALRATLRGSPTPVMSVTTAAPAWRGVPGATCLLARSGASHATWCVAGRRLLSGGEALDGPFLYGRPTLTAWSSAAPASDFSPTRGCPSACPHVSGLPGF